MPILHSQTFWAATAAVATIGYLVASILLWRTTKTVAQTGAEQVEALKRQIALTERVLSARLRPVVVLDDLVAKPTTSDFHYICTFTLRNCGQLPALRLQWEVVPSTNVGSLSQYTCRSREPIDLEPGADLPIECDFGDPFFKQLVAESPEVRFRISLQYRDEATVFTTDHDIAWDDTSIRRSTRVKSEAAGA